MARRLRLAPGGLAYHVMNRSSGDLELFAKPGDYEAFERVLEEARRRDPPPRRLRVCAYVLMPNHFHLVLWPRGDADLSRFMQWLTMTHTQRWRAHRHNAGRGHLYQSRFKSFPIQRDAHFLSVCRYVERNPLRAGLVERAEDWAWCSLACRQRPNDRDKAQRLLDDWPVDRPSDWLRRVNRAQTNQEEAALRESIRRGRPYGDDRWMASTAAKMGLQSTLRDVGRPPKAKSAAAVSPHERKPAE